MTAIELPDIAKGRGRPTAASKGLKAKRQYTRVITPEIIAMRRLGEGMWGRNWQVDFAPAVKYDSGLITRVLAGTRHMPEDMAQRIRAAIETLIADLTAVTENPLLGLSEINAGDYADTLVSMGETVWGTYWRRDLAAAVETDPGLLTNGLKGRRALTISGPMLKKAVTARIKTLKALLKDPFLKVKKA